MGNGRKAFSEFRKSSTLTGLGHIALFPALIRVASGPEYASLPNLMEKDLPAKLEAPPISWLPTVADLP